MASRRIRISWQVLQTMAALLTVVSTLMTPASGQTPVSVYLVAGQSNALGFGSCSGQWCDPQTDVMFFEAPLEGWIDLQPREFGSFGPELSSGRFLADADPLEQIAIFKYAKGGTALCDDWDPDSGPQWSIFVINLNAAMTQLESAGFTPLIKGMIWMQGESDPARGCAPEYEVNLRNFIQAVRILVGDGELPYAIGEVDDSGWSSDGAVQAAQMTIAAEDRNAGFVMTSDLVFNSDNIHFNTASQLTLGERFATELIRIQSLLPSDLDGNGAVNVTDLLELLAAWGPCDGCRADIDRDNMVGVTDLLALLTEWG